MRKIFQGTIISNYSLNKPNSSKRINHIELTAPNSASYRPGDIVVFVIHGQNPKEQLAYYSISSSPSKHQNQIHVTAAITQQVAGKMAYRNPSSQYLDSLQVGNEVNFFIKKNPSFKLPDDKNDVIMIGAGTGIAPFRAFLAERDERKASGKNWLFFGERNSDCDFLYRDELQNYLDSKLLSRLDTAFSRDQNHKVYVQDRMIENSAELFKWMEQGAFFYICGDKKNMAQNVEETLLAIVAKEQKKGEEAAKKYLEDLKSTSRFLLDVY